MTTVQRCTAADLTDTAIIWVKAFANDGHWKAMTGPASFEDEVKFTEMTLASRLHAGEELGACRTWKVVDGDGKMVAWAGLGVPKTLTAEAWSRIKPEFTFPPGGNQEVISWFLKSVMTNMSKYGYDPTKDFYRQGTIVHPAYQRQGLGRLLTAQMNALADKAGAATYVRAKPAAANLFVQEGFEVLERIDFDLEDFGVEGYGAGGKDGRSAFFVMRRLPGAEGRKGAKLDWGDARGER